MSLISFRRLKTVLLTHLTTIHIHTLTQKSKIYVGQIIYECRCLAAAIFMLYSGLGRRTARHVRGLGVSLMCCAMVMTSTRPTLRCVWIIPHHTPSIYIQKGQIGINHLLINLNNASVKTFHEMNHILMCAHFIQEDSAN